MTQLRRLPIYPKPPEELRGLLRVSPSQIEAGRLCLRRWFRSYVDYFREPQAPSAALGDRVHIVLQDHLTDGKPFDLETHEGRIANSGKNYLPPIGSGKCEDGFFMPVNGRWGWIGKVDWEDLQGLSYIDHKTTSDFKWMKSVDTLYKDPQGLVYGLKVIGDKSEQPGRWIYYKTKGSYVAKPVDFTISREQVADGIAELEAEAENLIELRKAKFLDLPPSPEACHAFGRPCPHKDMCTDLDGSSLLKGMFMATKTKEELLASLRANAVGPTVAPVTVPPVATAAPSLPIANQPPVVATVVGPAIANTPVSPANLLALMPKAGPPALLPVPPVVQPPVADATPGPQGVSGPPPTVAPEGANGPAFDPATIPGTPEAKRSRGRPPGSKNKPRGEVIMGAPKGTPEMTAGVERPVISEGMELDTLCINCIPQGLDYTHFPELSPVTVIDTRTFTGRDNLATLMSKFRVVMIPLP